MATNSSQPVSTGQGPLPDGTLVNGRYLIKRVLGTGAFGRVYLAEDTHDLQSPPLAIKELLDAQFTSPQDKQEAITWFKREVSTLLSLEHPGIPAIYGYWTAQRTAGPFYLEPVMNFQRTARSGSAFWSASKEKAT